MSSRRLQSDIGSTRGCVAATSCDVGVAPPHATTKIKNALLMVPDRGGSSTSYREDRLIVLMNRDLATAGLLALAYSGMLVA
jgi:hypothetical protein